MRTIRQADHALQVVALTRHRPDRLDDAGGVVHGAIDRNLFVATLGIAPVLTTQWFGPLALLAIGLLLAVLPLTPARNAAWINPWFRQRPGVASLLWSFAACGCLYSLWLQYELQFTLRPVLLLAPGFLYWFVVTAPGHHAQLRNIAAAGAQEAVASEGQSVEEVQRA